MKPYLVFMAGAGSITDIRELVDPIKPHIRGVCALLHDCDSFSPEAIYLLKINNELGGGNIIFGSYVGRHDHSRNRILYETGIKEEDWYCQCDTLERIMPQFLEILPEVIKQNPQLEALYYFGKPLAVKFKEELFYKGTPHESLYGLNGQYVIELNKWYPDDNHIRKNMRPIKRDKDHHINHYAFYLLQPNSNQNILGLEHRGGYDKLAHYETLRKNLVSILDSCEYPRTVDGLKKLLNTKTFCKALRDIVNQNGWINNFYRYHILGERDLVDSHDWSNLPQF